MNIDITKNNLNFKKLNNTFNKEDEFFNYVISSKDKYKSIELIKFLVGLGFSAPTQRSGQANWSHKLRKNFNIAIFPNQKTFYKSFETILKLSDNRKMYNIELFDNFCFKTMLIEKYSNNG